MTNEKSSGFGLEQLLPGSTIESPKSIYIIGKLLRNSGFRAVYIVRDVADLNAEYALKAERKCKNVEDSKLKREVTILKMLTDKDSTHFPMLVDRGKKETFNFLVVQLVGKNLYDLKMSRPKKVLSVGTGLEVCRQCMKALGVLHKHGFVHRDVKPANFAVSQNSRTVYAIDVGYTRRFLNARGGIIPPRTVAGFKGSLKYAPINGHRRMELGPKDDCESWLYTLLDLILPAGLPWSACDRKEDVGRLKEECRFKRSDFFSNISCARELDAILDYVDKLRYEDRVDYSYIYSCILAAAATSKVNLEDRYDWQKESTPATAAAEKAQEGRGPLRSPGLRKMRPTGIVSKGQDLISGRPEPMLEKNDSISGKQDVLSGRQDRMSERQEAKAGRQDWMSERRKAKSGRQDRMSERQEAKAGRQDWMSERRKAKSVRRDWMSERREAKSVRQDRMSERQEAKSGRKDPMSEGQKAKLKFRKRRRKAISEREQALPRQDGEREKELSERQRAKSEEEMPWNRPTKGREVASPPTVKESNVGTVKSIINWPRKRRQP